MAGFWSGAAKAVGEISEERFRRQEQEKEREFSRSTSEEDRKFEIDMYKMKAADEQEKLLQELRIKRKAADAASGSSVNEYTALATRLQGAEGAEEYLSTVAKDPRVASQILETITDIQERSQREITPSEIIQYITPIVTEEGGTVLTFDDELEQLMYEDALSEVDRPEPALSVSGSLYNEYSQSDVDLAEENFTSAMLDLARKDVEGLTEAGAPEAADVTALINEAEGGNSFAMTKLANRYGNNVIADFYVSMQENTFLRPIIASGAYGSRIQRFDALVQSYERGELSDEMAQQLQETYPQVFN
jgi:hypothetical protein